MDNTIINHILENTYTKLQLVRRVRVLEEFINYILFDHRKEAVIETKMYIEGFLALHKDDLLKDDSFLRESSWLETLDKEFWQKFNPSNINKLFKEINSYIERLKTITIFLPVELPETQQASIGQWLKQNVSGDAIFEINYDPNLIGGCGLSLNGIYKDYSLRGRINDNRQAILESLRNFHR